MPNLKCTLVVLCVNHVKVNSISKIIYMKFPAINYNFNDFSEARELVNVVEQKLATIEKHLHGSQSVSCDVEFNKVSSNKTGQINKIEVNLMVDGMLHRAEATEESFEKAVDEVRADLDKELRRSNDKQTTLGKQAGREVKKKMMTE